jgi:L-2-hydroxyglutarate oxidase LhgO
MAEFPRAAVIGAGVVGLACAAELARRGCDVVVLEADDCFGGGISSRNSEVLHGGMYYPTGSLRAQHCVRGRALAYEYCEARGIGHRRTGKLIVATDETERDLLERLLARGRDNGVEELRLLGAAEAKAMEPELHCVGALHSPGTGVIDSHGLMLSLLADLEDHGGCLALRTPVQGVVRHARGYTVRFGGEDPDSMEADLVINAAGLGAQDVARTVEGYDLALCPRSVPTKGNYFALSARTPFSRLIYPAPVEGGLGIHMTLDLAGRARFGPDVEWGPVTGYEVDPARGESFYAAIRRYWPGLPDNSLTPDYAGVRPKLTGRGEAAADFLMQTEDAHGLPGLVHLFGIESPGLTSSLSLARAVADRAMGHA